MKGKIRFYILNFVLEFLDFVQMILILFQIRGYYLESIFSIIIRFWKYFIWLCFLFEFKGLI